MQKRGVSRLFVQNFLSHGTEKFRWGTLRCIRKFRVSKNYMHQRRGVSRSPSKIFCQTVPKNFVGEHFGVSENFGYRKIICIRERGGYHVLRQKFFVTQYRKISLGNTSVFQKISCIAKFYA